MTPDTDQFEKNTISFLEPVSKLADHHGFDGLIVTLFTVNKVSGEIEVNHRTMCAAKEKGLEQFLSDTWPAVEECIMQAELQKGATIITRLNDE